MAVSLLPTSNWLLDMSLIVVMLFLLQYAHWTLEIEVKLYKIFRKYVVYFVLRCFHFKYVIFLYTLNLKINSLIVFFKVFI